MFNQLKLSSRFAGASFVSAALACALAGSAASAQCTGFALTQSTGATIDPGVTDIGSHGDDTTNTVTLPFAFSVYGVAYTSLNASSNGNVQFTGNNSAYSNVCLPAAGMGVMIAPHWDDLRTDGVNEGIFTSTVGVAPNRVFNIEWRAHYFTGAATDVANFEVRLFEDQSHFEIIYGVVSQGGSSATVGVQDVALPPTQVQCNAGGIAAGQKLTFSCTNLPIPPTGIGAATPGTVNACGVGGTSLLTIAVTPGFSPASSGITVTANLSSIGGSAAQVFYDDGTHGDAAGGNNTFSFSALVPPSATPGVKSLSYTVSDAQGRSSNGTIGLQVNPCPVAGPDVFVARLTDVAYYGATGNISAYAVGTDACNNGDLPVNWLSNVNQHPVIAQNFFRLKNGRFEQIGQSWLKHGFSSTNSGTCGTCQQPAGGGTQLGVSCSDAYGAGLNGSQGLLGPRSQVNATTGVYPYPFTAPTYDPTIGRRLQVFTADIDPAQNSGALYFADCHYVTSDDAQWINGALPAANGLNNATYQQILIPSTTATPSLTGTEHRMMPGIQAWKDQDPTVQLATAEYVDTSLVATGVRARFLVAGKATDNGNGTWHYEYAVYNLNADRNGGSFSVPIPAGVGVANIGFHGVFAHSGEPFPNTATNADNWAGSVSSGAITWSAPEPFVGPNGDNANALRWGTMYNFRFDASTAPTAAGGRVVSIGLFKPGTPTSVSAALIGPGSACGAADFDGVNGITVQDIFAYLSAFFAGDPRADFNHFGGIGVQDIFDFLAAWFAGC